MNKIAIAFIWMAIIGIFLGIFGIIYTENQAERLKRERDFLLVQVDSLRIAIQDMQTMYVSPDTMEVYIIKNLKVKGVK